MEKKKIFDVIKNYTFLTFGIACVAFGWSGFLIPSKIISGGLAGISTLLAYQFGWNIGLTTLALNGFLILLAIKIIGASFGVKTVYGAVLFSTLLTIFVPLFPDPVVSDRFMATVLGGIIAGVGGGIIFINGGSSGGTDIIAMIINKYKNLSLGRLLMMVDAVIITSSYLVYQSVETIAYGFVTLSITAYAIDMLITGDKQSVQFLIISKEYQKIADTIIHDANRGVTILNGSGGFSGSDVKVLMVMARKNESTRILKLVQEIDPDAFLTMGSVMGVYGQGFDKIRI